MRKSVLLIAAAIAAALSIPAAAAADGKAIPGQYIVVLKDGASLGDTVADHRRGPKADVLMTYGAAVKGYAAKLSPEGLARVENDPRVDYVQQDVEGIAIQAKGGGGTTTPPPPPPPPPGQMLPTGVDRIDAELASPTVLATADATTKQTAGDVAVYDTGVQSSHPDLNVAGGVNCLGTYTGHDGTYNDQNGHGTHVAGIIGARDNSVGSVGVAPGVRIWSVRTLNNIGSGSASTQLCGINWITQNGPALGIKVVNSSQVLFGSPDDGNCGYTRGDVLHQAICASTNAGILWVFGAGNSAASWANTSGPSFREVLTVTGMGDKNGAPNVPSTATFACTPPGARSAYASQVDDKYTTFSNWAVTTVDQSHVIAAPGACIYSTYKDSGYGYMSGTSMAGPHAAAVAHRCILSGQCPGTPAETIQKLRADAQAWNDANPGYGFTGDPRRPVTGRHYGYLIRAAGY
jgi:subtilisin family serine protease